MITRLMKYVSITVLFAAIPLWRYASSYRVALCFIICLGAVVVAAQAARAKRHFWATGFFLMAAIFNPVLIVVPFAGKLSFMLVLTGILAFAASLPGLKTQPLLSMPSITDRTPGSQSL